MRPRRASAARLGLVSRSYPYAERWLAVVVSSTTMSTLGPGTAATAVLGADQRRPVAATRQDTIAPASSERFANVMMAAPTETAASMASPTTRGLEGAPKASARFSARR